jgi:hypothetical protein
VTGVETSQDNEPGDDFPDDNHPPSKQVVGCLLALVAQPVLMPILFYFNSRSQIERGWLVIGLLSTFIVILYQHRNNLRKIYFVAVAPPLFLAELLAALMVPLSDWHYGRAIMPSAILVLMLNIAILRLFERIWYRKSL